MFELTQALGVREALMREAVPLVAALLVAEVFYKFHSFLAEAAVFLVTWYVFSAIRSMVWRRQP